jgi:hypothetical protein
VPSLFIVALVGFAPRSTLPPANPGNLPFLYPLFVVYKIGYSYSTGSNAGKGFTQVLEPSLPEGSSYIRLYPSALSAIILLVTVG